MEPIRQKFSHWQRQSRDVGFMVRGAVVILVAFGLAGVVVRGLVGLAELNTPTLEELITQMEAPVDGDGDDAQPVGDSSQAGNASAIFTAYQKLANARAARDWLGVALWVTCVDVLSLWSPLFALSLVAGAVWFVIAAQFAGFGRRQLRLYFAGIALGCVSATLTLIVVVMQEMRGFTQGTEFLDQMIYWIAGVGLREEFFKLLCFAPLLLFLRQREDIDALVCGAMVGLGFAIQENTDYFLRQGPTDALGRMMTANFMHLALTAVAARALFRMVKRPRRHWEEFLATFIAVVVVHGLYDAFIGTEQLQELALASFVILAVIAYQFCTVAGSIGRLRPAKSFSPVALLVFGLAILTGSVYLFLCWLMPPAAALVICGEAVVGLFPVAVVYISRLHEH